MKLPRFVTTHPRIASGKDWIFYVRHDRNGAWSFLPMNHLRAPARCKISLEKLQAIDSSISKLLQLGRGWHAHRQFPGEQWQKSPLPTGPTRLLTCEAVPIPGTADANQFGGAFVNIWVRDKSETNSQRVAARLMEEAGWRPITEFDHIVLRREEVSIAGRKDFDQAQIDGEVIVFHTYPARSAVARS